MQHRSRCYECPAILFYNGNNTKKEESAFTFLFQWIVPVSPILQIVTSTEKEDGIQNGVN